MAKAQTTVDDIAPGVQDELGVAEGLLDTADPIAIMRSLRHALTRVALRPQRPFPHSPVSAPGSRPRAST